MQPHIGGESGNNPPHVAIVSTDERTFRHHRIGYTHLPCSSHHTSLQNTRLPSSQAVTRDKSGRESSSGVRGTPEPPPKVRPRAG